MKIRSRFTTFYITIHITIILSSLWMGVLDEQIILQKYGYLAQLAEHSAVNRKVIGSCPIVSVTLPLWRNIQRKECFIIVLITDKECKFLLSKGWKWRDHIHRTVSGANKKYATENYRLMQDLEIFRSQSIKETIQIKKRKK